MHLQLDQISRRFGNQFGIYGVSTKIEAGSITAVLGANGTGKSTLLKLIAGWMPVSSGRITLDNRLVKPSRASVRREIHLIDTPRSYDGPCTKVIFDVVNDYQLHRDSIATEIAEWFERLNLIGVYNKKAIAISKGQLYKLTMLGLFLVRPHVWLLDEPFSSGLDANGLEVLQQQIRSHAKCGGIVIFSTQWPEQAKRLADNLLVIEDGRLIWDAAISKAPSPQLISRSGSAAQAVLRGVAAGV